MKIVGLDPHFLVDTIHVMPYYVSIDGDMGSPREIRMAKRNESKKTVLGGVEMSDASIANKIASLRADGATWREVELEFGIDLPKGKFPGCVIYRQARRLGVVGPVRDEAVCKCLTPHAIGYHDVVPASPKLAHNLIIEQREEFGVEAEA